MNTCLVVLTHTFRINSLIFRKALKEYDSITVLYISPWYNSKKERQIIKSGSDTFYKQTFNYFANELKEKLDIPLYVLKTELPGKAIDNIVNSHKITEVFYDMPLFGKDVWLKCNSPLSVIDSDTYDPACTKMTAKSRWVYWSKNRKNINVEKPQIKKCACKDINLPIFKANEKIAIKLKEEIDKVQKRLEAVIPLYHKTRNHKEGSTRLSKYLHHGVIDSAELTAELIKILPNFIDKDHIIVPLLRQLAFREICIRKARIKNLSLENKPAEWAKELLDSKSYDNLLKELLGSFTREQFLSGTTGNKILDNTIKLGIKERWIPNRIRMWLSSQCFYGIGGGINSLKTLIDFFDMYIEDAQSPNNYVCCVEEMRMQYGKVMNYNTIRSFRLIEQTEKR